MDKSELTQFYDKLKSSLNQPTTTSTMLSVGGPRDFNNPGAEIYKRKAMACRDELENQCAKHIIVDVYCKILPLDNDYVCGHHGRMCQDVDAMLASKNMTASQYLTSCSESTKAPLLEFVQRSIKNIGKSYMEEANADLKNAQENNEDIVAPSTPDTETDDNIQNQLVDIKEDPEYDSFIDKLKKKTINKIVSDVSKIINNKKEEKDMTFDPNPEATIADTEAATESTVSIGLDYLQKKLLKENVDVTDDMRDQMIALAIRESTLNQLDVVFMQPEGHFKEFVSNIRFNKGVLINESAVNYFILESVDPDIVYTEGSHDRLKFDYRKGYDLNTGHQILLIYSLDNINVPYPGMNFDKNHTGREMIKNKMAKEGNIFHQSYGQKLLAIKDLFTQEKLQEVEYIGVDDVKYTRPNELQLDKLEYENDMPSKYRKYKNPQIVFKVKVGNIDTEAEARNTKSTKFYKQAIETDPSGERKRDLNWYNHKDAPLYRTSGRGAKLDSMLGVHTDRKTGKEGLIYNHPSEKDVKSNPELYRSYIGYPDSHKK
jgi:hypothetical protein